MARLGVAWEWLVARVGWTSVAFAILRLVLPDDLDRSDPLAWVFVALMLALVGGPAAVRIRRSYLQHSDRPQRDGQSRPESINTRPRLFDSPIWRDRLLGTCLVAALLLASWWWNTGTATFQDQTSGWFFLAFNTAALTAILGYVAGIARIFIRELGRDAPTPAHPEPRLK
jgi:hypothetical protein